MTLQSTRNRGFERALLRSGTTPLELEIVWDSDGPVRLAGVRVDGRALPLHAMPLVDVVTAGGGRVPASSRLAHSAIGSRLRYVTHRERRTASGRALEVTQAHEGIEVISVLELDAEAPVVRSAVTVVNRGLEAVVLQSVTSSVVGLPVAEPDPLGGWGLVRGRSDWLGEGRWSASPLRGPQFPVLSQQLTGHNPRGALVATSDGTWSTGGELPTAGLVHADAAVAVVWQIEHNGAWRWEIGEDTDGGYVALSGPTDADSAWTQPLAPGERFDTVPAAFAFGDDIAGAIAALTTYRRVRRRPHADNTALPVVFNDYMNTLDGDPTTERLLPLIAAAGAAGAEIFCIDAGWYDDTGHWWESVGEWTASSTRFPGGLGEVIDAIRDAGMTPGLWLEPEVIGVHSVIADRLPADAFLQRHGERIVEHGRYHLDLRHPSAIAHLDQVVDRLISDYGIGFFKFDYNINPGAGTDIAAASVGAGLLAHNRAHLAWLDSILDRHPELVIENCASGAMRMDFAMLSRLAMQSTSDQQDFVKYPPIAASAPISMLPEQAASWAYPQPEMDAEAAAFCLVTGLLGRYYVSGHLNRMSDAQRDLVAEAIAAAKSLRPLLPVAVAHWPLGLPEWTADWVALGLRVPQQDLVSVWRRGDRGEAVLSFPHLIGTDVTVTTVFPAHLPAWRTEWDAATGNLTVHSGDSDIAARTLRLDSIPIPLAQDDIHNRSE